MLNKKLNRERSSTFSKNCQRCLGTKSCQRCVGT